MNGGYFDLTNGQSYSLVINDGKMLSPNVKALTRTLNGAATSYFPTRAAFGLINKKPSFAWIYNVSGTSNYAYPQASPNLLNSPPQAKPSETFPSGGALWSPQVAIGGSPMLLKNGAITITDTEELIDINNKTGRSRSALGYTASNRLIFLAIEKNSTSTNVGASLVEEAQLLKDMGCTDAINLDGGGSTCLLVNNGKTTNLPEGNTQRAVTSVIMLKKK
jgi:exopolysaccharide biosynthesis protein